MRVAVTSLLAVLVFAAVAGSGDEPRSILENGSFESVAPMSVSTATPHGKWKLGEDGKGPSGWTLNTSYPGTLTVLEEHAAEGDRYVRIVAGPGRDAQIYRPCSSIRPGKWYRISAQVRNGAATLLVYEYRADGSVKARPLASGTGTARAWKRITGFYTPPEEGFRSASVALLVPKGKSAAIDDVLVHEMDGSAAGRSRPVRLANREVELTIGRLGRLESFVLKATGEDYADPEAPTPVLSAVHRGVRVPLASLTKRGNLLTARFADQAIAVKLRVEVRDRHFLFEVEDAEPDDLEGLELRFPVKPLRVRDAWMPGTYDDEFGVCQMSVTANTEVRLARYGAAVAPEARWYRRHGIVGGKSVLVASAADRFLQAIRTMELETGLPSPELSSGAPGETSSKDWARLSPAVKRSYLFATWLGPRDLDALIRYAKVGGFGMIMLHRKTWRASAGHETIARDRFPKGLPDLVAACRKIHAAGLRVGLHLYGPSISLNDAYVTPVPDRRLLTLDVAPLARPLDEKATELALTTKPTLPRRASPGVYPGNLLRLGDEIIRWTELIPGAPCRLTGLTRGALGTTAASHGAGEEVRSFVQFCGRLLVDPASDLPEEMGEHLGRVVNATGADLVYFDGAGTAPAGKAPDRWYYINRTLLGSCAAFDHGVIVQTALGPGRQLAWHLVPRSASADGHGDLKGYLDQRLPGILQMRRTWTAADIGWYALDVHGRPDELEYVCAKALGTDSSISVQATRSLLETHPRAREVFEMIARWERRRLAGDVPVETRKLLQARGREFRLLEEGDEWSIWEAEYEAERPVPAGKEGADSWSVVNDREGPVRLGLTISREAVATTPAAHVGAGSVNVIDLADLSGFGDADDPVLRGYAQIGEREINADGLSLRGVKTTLARVSGAPGGAVGVVFSADNGTNGAGWCTTGRKLAKPLDLSRSKAVGLWVRGDGRGETLAVILCDGAGKRERHNITLDFSGWRFRSFPLRGAIDRSRIEYVLFELSHISPNSAVRAGIAEVRAVPDLHVPRPIRSVTITIGERSIVLPVSIEPNRCVTIDALGRGIAWPGGMAEGRPFDVEGGPLILPPGRTTMRIEVQPREDYAGDLAVRICRTWKLTE